MEASDVNHPLVEHHLAVIRDRDTGAAAFRASVRALTMLVGVEATASLRTAAATVQTPVSPAEVRKVNDRVALVPILRAGLGMVDPMLELLPDATVWHLGLFRDEATATPVSYYDKLADATPPDVAMVLDPMLATGGSIAMALDRLKKWGVKDLIVLGLIGSEPGRRRIAEAFPEVPVHLATVDAELNDRAYIVPGLGDAGDRIFGTL